MIIKNSLFLFSTFLFLNSWSQDIKISSKKVPNAIKEFLQKERKPDGKVVYFQEIVDGEKLIEANFKQNKIAYSCSFNAGGQLVEEEFKTSFLKLNAQTQTNIKTYLEKTFKRFKILECQGVTKNGEEPDYELEIRHANQEKELLFNHQGIHLKTFENNPAPINTQH